ncbi:BRO family protein, partial [Brevibacillus centrosporus]
MNNPQVFNHQMFGELPVIIIDGMEWFGGNEAAGSLGFTNPRAAIAHHVDKEDVTVRDTLTSGGIQTKKFVNESGLYGLIFGAAKQGNNPELQSKAKEYKRWVTSEVLPTIRKHGAYLTPDTIEKALSDPDFI